MMDLQPRGKAIMLVGRFVDEATDLNYKLSKQYALIAVDEIIEVLDKVSIAESGRVLIDYGQSYWKEVKEEIKKLPDV